MFVIVLRLPFTALHYTWDSILLLSQIFMVAYQYPFQKVEPCPQGLKLEIDDKVIQSLPR